MSQLPSESQLTAAYSQAKERYAAQGVNTDAALRALAPIALSLHCWQGDDVVGLENTGEALSGGIATTGNYPGKARSAEELRADLDLAFRLIPGRHRLNLHAMYAETGGRRVARNEIEPIHFTAWTDWARDNGHGVDFNPTCFSHPLAASGFTLSSADTGIQKFWIEHCQASRKIGEHFGRALGTSAITNIWIPDGYKDIPVDRKGPRERLAAALDAVMAEKLDPRFNLDAVEGKLFGLGSESYVVGSHEFYLAYAISRNVLLCLDAGHFHPTETIADKISSVLVYLPEILLHVSRGVRWDSDHVVLLTDDLNAIMQEIVRGDFARRVHIGLDYFDASINRVAAWVIGSRAALRALLSALLEPAAELRAMEQSADFTGRLATLEEAKGLPAGAVWDYYCLQQGVPVGLGFLDEIRSYERTVQSKRG